MQPASWLPCALCSRAKFPQYSPDKTNPTDKQYVDRYDYTLQAMKEIPYNKWREYDPEATVRFYALRLRDAGMIKASPQKIIAQGTAWRFLSELKRELKGWPKNRPSRRTPV